jgi:hypothetical protein
VIIDKRTQLEALFNNNIPTTTCPIPFRICEDSILTMYTVIILRVIFDIAINGCILGYHVSYTVRIGITFLQTKCADVLGTLYRSCYSIDTRVGQN